MHCDYRIVCAFIIAFGIVACDASPATGRAPRNPQFGESRDAVAVNARGENVSLADFSGKPVWVDYAAEWCAACRPQSATIRSLAGAYGDDVVFVTVMTSEPEGYGHPATVETAARWARRATLDPARVVAGDHSSMTLPQHALFSADGEELFRHVGALSAAEIRATIQRSGGAHR